MDDFLLCCDINSKYSFELSLRSGVISLEVEPRKNDVALRKCCIVKLNVPLLGIKM